MIIDLNAMLRGEVNSIDIDFVLTPEIIEDVTFTDDARVYGKITNSAGYMRLKLNADLPYVGECARCLDEVRGIFSLEFERTVERMTAEMREAARALEFEKAAYIRDRIKELKKN